MAELFGTDGIRGRANVFPITCDVALKTGRAVGTFCRKNGYDAVVIGKDTRISGDMLEAALSAGVASTGIEVRLAGVIPTPGVAHLCACLNGVGAGIVISASHNPYYDNGIKIFGPGGVKLSDKEEDHIESMILKNDHPNGAQENVGKISFISDSLDIYARFLKSGFPPKKPDRPLRLVVDASNGAASVLCKKVFHDQWFDALFIHDQPDGFNINDCCGSQHTGDLVSRVKDTGADLGLAFDGDADRLIAVDETGQIITGDRILAICGQHAKSKDRLRNNMIVSTVMSNIGLTKSLESLGIEHIKTSVGDRKVLEAMKRQNAVIGGEDSGHLIFLSEHTTGDGVLSALKLIEVMVETGKPLSELAGIMTVYPQVLMNVEVDASRPDFNKIAPIVDAIGAVEQQLGDSGRVLVRYSGTQPLLRVMVEGPDMASTRNCCEMICRAIKDNM